MKHLFYKDWTKKRLQKIIDIFGADWFNNKKILELGACYGDIGIELLNLGADVTFSDARKEYLNNIEDTLLNLNYKPNLITINQEFDYNLDNHYDLILHLGLLYNIKNWKNDLQCALKHTNLMILETMVNPNKESIEITSPEGFNYGPCDGIMSVVPQEVIEEEITNLGFKFLRFDNESLNSEGWFFNDCKIKHIYNWNYKLYDSQIYNNTPNYFTHFRRFWIIIK